MTTATETVHVFELAGLGKAPFRCVGTQQNWFYVPGVPGSRKPGGTCNYCGTGIAHECLIQSADGKRFVVGCECVKRTGDRGLKNAVKLAQRKARQEKAAAKRQAEWEARGPERERRQRTRDIIASERAFAVRKREASMTERNGWLIDVLNGMPGDFCESMAETLRTNRLDDLSDRCVNILRDIYAKSHGRRNSKAYSAAEDVFDSHLDG